jgi:hypothetical protein
MSQYAWKPFLKRWSSELLEDEEFRAEIPPEVTETGWLGSAPATDEQIAEVEARLGKPLPPSYREFLKVTNGGFAEQYFLDHLLSAENIEWLATSDPYWIADARKLEDRVKRTTQEIGIVPRYVANYVPPKELEAMLQIGVDVTGERYFLNPTMIDEDGEWQAIEYSRTMTSANRSPLAEFFDEVGQVQYEVAKATRYRSFWDLMQAKYAFSRYVSMVDLMNLRGDTYQNLRTTLQVMLRAAEITSADLSKNIGDQLTAHPEMLRDVSLLMGIQQGLTMTESTLRILLSRLLPEDDQNKPF